MFHVEHKYIWIMSQPYYLTGQIVDIHNERIFPGTLFVKDGIIKSIQELEQAEGPYILPGFVDSHIHIESSMLTPQHFALEAVKHGIVATVSDPHEIANVLGENGIQAMLEDSRKSPFKFFYGVPSCVPATPFETSGAVLDSQIVHRLLGQKEFYYLAEMMNFPGVIQKDPEVMKKLESARYYQKPVDGHIPGVQGDDLTAYIQAGISTDHEVGDYQEAVEKIRKGMMVQIREGSAAKDFDNLFMLIDEYPDQVMLCSDDKHPDDLIQGHINKLIERGLQNGLNLFNLLRAAVLNPVMHYNLPVGLLRENDPADFILIDSLDHLAVKETYINGNSVYQQNKGPLFHVAAGSYPNIMEAQPVTVQDLKIPYKDHPVKVIQAQDRSLLTDVREVHINAFDNVIVSDPEQDILKIVVLNRYKKQPPAVGLIQNFGLNQGAIATSVAHDSHNIICVGADDESIAQAINQVIEMGGGNVVVTPDETEGLPLEFGGLMTCRPASEVAQQYTRLTSLTQKLGCSLMAPFMTLAFMALPVIPKLKITDQGLFDVNQFAYTDLFVYKG